VLLIVGLSSPAVTQGDSKRVIAYLANDTLTLDSRATTVGGLLDELSIELPSEGMAGLALDAALTDGMGIPLNDMEVVRGHDVREVEPVVQFSEGWRYGPAGVEIVEPGLAGQVRTDVTLFFHDGQEVGRRQRETVLRRMHPKKVVYFHTLTADDGPGIDEILKLRARPGSHTPPPARYRRIVTMESSAYEPGPQSCGPFASGNTSCGLKAGYGVVAVDPDVIPLYTRLYIEGYGYAVAGDVGSAIQGNKIDLGMLTVDECYDWGRRDVKVYILY